MPLITCPECGTMVSGTAKACPTCGARAKTIARAQRQPEKQVGRVGKIMIGGALLGVVAAASLSMMQDQRPAAASDPKADALFQQRGEAAVEDAVRLKGSLRDPDSLTFEKIRTNDDGSLVCISYLARNGFGGMNRQHAAFIAGLDTASAAIWNKRCADVELNDDTERTVQMIGLLRH